MLLAFTPALWSPSMFYIMGTTWDMMMIGAGMVSTGTLTNVFEAHGFFNKTSCLTFNETQVAITSGDAVVSGFYGPGVYLAWLISSWTVAISSIASAKLAANNPQRLELDPELISLVFYPLVAAMDIIVRVIRCNIDASMTAATFVVVTSLSIFSPMARLSIQKEGTEFRESIFSNGKRVWTIRILRWISHAIVGSVVAEPYANHHAITVLWGLLFVTVLYSGVVGRYRLFKDHYQPSFRSWQERLVFFFTAQIIFSIFLVTTGPRSFWPETSASLFDLDQIVTLIGAVIVLVLFKTSGWAYLLQAMGRALPVSEEQIPLMDISQSLTESVEARRRQGHDSMEV